MTLFLIYCVTFASQRVSLIVIPFCLSVWISVGHSATYSLPRLIDHNQIWSAGIYLSSDPCKPFWIPCLPYFGCQREKYAKFRLFPTRILATANVTHRDIWLVLIFASLTSLSVLYRRIRTNNNMNGNDGRRQVSHVLDKLYSYHQSWWNLWLRVRLEF